MFRPVSQSFRCQSDCERTGPTGLDASPEQVPQLPKGDQRVCVRTAVGEECHTAQGLQSGQRERQNDQHGRASVRLSHLRTHSEAVLLVLADEPAATVAANLPIDETVESGEDRL